VSILKTCRHVLDNAFSKIVITKTLHASEPSMIVTTMEIFLLDKLFS